MRAFGAVGDGKTIDSPAIDRAIEAAAAAGGGTVVFPAGTYASYSIHLRSDITLRLGPGATLLAAESTAGRGYDAPEPNVWGDEHEYQDFGHSHWHNSLIWGEGVENVTIEGPGLIDGKGLWRGLHPPLGPAPSPNAGNKAIALKLAKNVVIRGISILRAGHFGILATGVDNLTIEGVKIDTNRDGIDVDACRNVRISDVSVNTPNDDAIVLKASYALGEARPTENVTITNSFVSGFEMGSMLDGTYRPPTTPAPDREGPAGRIKLGTESNGDFRNITISNVVFDHSRGLALESVDGSKIEDVAVSNLTMRHTSSAPIFVRLGARMRGPAGTPVGSIRRVSIDNVVVSDADPRYAATISGIPGHPVEDVTLSNVRIVSHGGLTLDDVARQPAALVNTFFFPEPRPREPYAVPEREKAYPEPSMFGLLPAYGFYIRHARGVELNDVDVAFQDEDRRPAFVLEDVQGADFHHVKAETAAGVPTFVLEDVRDFSTFHSSPVKDMHLERVNERRSIP
ncbi:MAG TPA: glycosyl hydrolase family 28 protein [Longimicrobiaceae bacterium]|nr:glycosyl hydrolase family 28 protein [Longimicrobiaceae bacterium]